MSLIARGEKAINERYRPMKFSEVIGCEKTKQALTKWMERGKFRSRALLLYGESGCIDENTVIKVRKISNKKTTICKVVD